MPRARRPLLVVLAVTCSIGLTACGGSGDPDTGGTPKPKIVGKAKFLTRGDAVCKDFHAKLAGLTAPASESDGHAIAAYLRQGAELTADAADQLDALGRPDADAPLIDSIVTAQRDTASRARQAAGVFDSDDVPGGNAQLKAVDESSDKAKADSKQFGFTVCGSDS